MSAKPTIPITGVLCEGQLVLLGWPEPHEYDLITTLRNQRHVRTWFTDDRLLDLEKNRQWLQEGMNRPVEGLLSIRFRQNDTFLGTVGWSDWDREQSVANFGRLMIDMRRVRTLRQRFPEDYPGIAIDACLTLRNYAMGCMRLQMMHTYFFEANLLAHRVNESVGMRETGRCVVLRADGSEVSVIEMSLRRDEWKQLVCSRFNSANLLGE